jgi:hypothetical protein
MGLGNAKTETAPLPLLISLPPMAIKHVMANWRYPTNTEGGLPVPWTFRPKVI